MKQHETGSRHFVLSANTTKYVIKDLKDCDKHKYNVLVLILNVNKSAPHIVLMEKEVDESNIPHWTSKD
jgi:hypothetical protein